MLGDVLLKLYHGKMPMLVKGSYDWVDARCVVKGVLAAEKKGRFGEKYILSGHRAPIREIARLVEEVTGRKAPRIALPIWVASMCVPFVELFSKLTGKRQLFTHDSLRPLKVDPDFCRDKAARELDHQPRSLKESIEDTFTWFRENGWLEN